MYSMVVVVQRPFISLRYIRRVIVFVSLSGMFAGIRADWSSPIRMWYRKRYDIVPDQSHYTATGLFQLFGLSSRRVGGLDTITALVTCVCTETHVCQLDIATVIVLGIPNAWNGTSLITFYDYPTYDLVLCEEQLAATFGRSMFMIT